MTSAEKFERASSVFGIVRDMVLILLVLGLMWGMWALYDLGTGNRARINETNAQFRTFLDANQTYITNHHLTQSKVDGVGRKVDDLTSLFCSAYTSAGKPQPAICAGR